jgi:hypothetical protein
LKGGHLVSTFSDLGGEVKYLRRLVVKEDKTWSAFNPSIGIAPDGKMSVAMRSSNYVILRHGELSVVTGGPIKSQVWFSELSDEFELQNLRKIDFSKTNIKIERGIEDPKLLWRDNRWMFMGVILERNVPVARNCLCYMDKKSTKVEKIEIIPGYDANKPEKNWMTANVPPKNFDYVYDALGIVTDGKIVRRTDEKSQLSKLRGNANLLEQSDGTYLAIMHSLDIRRAQMFSQTTFGYVDYVEKFYDHVLVRFDENGWAIELGEPFNFDFNGIEFVNGFIERGDDFIISFGREDVSAHVGVIPKVKLLKGLKKLK